MLIVRLNRCIVYAVRNFAGFSIRKMCLTAVTHGKINSTQTKIDLVHCQPSKRKSVRGRKKLVLNPVNPWKFFYSRFNGIQTNLKRPIIRA